MFHTLAKMSQDCAMDKQDGYRALTNNLISGRLLQLDFEVALHNLNKVSNEISGIGESSVRKMEQFLTRRDGKCDKIAAYEKDPQRMAMRVMKNIWGVGQAMVSKAICLYDGVPRRS